MLYHLVLYVFYTCILFYIFAFRTYRISFTYVSYQFSLFLTNVYWLGNRFCDRLANRFYKRLSKRVEDRVGEMLCFSIYDFCERFSKWFCFHLSRSICPILSLSFRYASSFITLGVCSLVSNCSVLLITFRII